MQQRECSFEKDVQIQDAEAVVAQVISILLAEIPGAVGAHRADVSNDKLGVDYWVEMSSGYHLAVDVKIRRVDMSVHDKSKDDLALETFSVLEVNKLGWTRDTTKRCDYILWLWLDTQRTCLMPFRMLCCVFCEHWQYWLARYGGFQQCTDDRYHSECIFVPRREVWAKMYQRFGGEVIQGREH